MNDVEKIRQLVMEYNLAQSHNSRADGNYQYAPQLYASLCTGEYAKLVDAITVPFNSRVWHEASSKVVQIYKCKNENGGYTFNGHDKTYYEWLRKDAIRKINEQDDNLDKACLIEEYGKQILEASKFFELVEAVDIIKGENIRRDHVSYGESLLAEKFRLARNMIINDYLKGKCSLEDIADYAGLDVDTVEKLVEERKRLDENHV